MRDALAPVIGDNRDAVVLDFFAGSGTTAHAVALLNRADGGRRSSILVTNNEVGLTDAQALRRDGKRPGDAEWEARGIFESVTRPRLSAAWTGRRADGSAVTLEYEDGFAAAEGLPENIAFLEIRYLDSDDVEFGLSFDDLAPLLWLRAGAKGSITGRPAGERTPLPFIWTDSYGVLFDEDRWRRFVDARPVTARTAFLVTHSPTAFAGVAAELPTDMSVVRIPDSYLSMFLPDRGRA